MKAVILTGTGDTFCIGLDIDHLKAMQNFSLEQNQEDIKKLFRLYQTIYELHKPVVALVNSPALVKDCGLA